MCGCPYESLPVHFVAMTQSKSREMSILLSPKTP